MRLFLIVLSFVFLLLPKNIFGQVQDVKREFTFMFYNTENLFDCENDSLTNDDEYTPNGNRRWNQSRYYSKVERLAKVILAAGKWNPPVFVGLCEVENRKVLESLTGLAPLNKFTYKIIHKDSPDERGIDVALIYRPDLFRPFDYVAIPVVDPDDKSFKTRDILQVSGVLNNCDTIHVFVNHWPSRYGGLMETKKLRMLAAETLNLAVKRLFNSFPKAKIICMGDFNDTPIDESLIQVFKAIPSDNPGLPGEMINLSANWLSNQVQTIKSQYTWAVFDQFIVSDYFLLENPCFKFFKAEIFNSGFLLEPDVKFGGTKPRRTYVGFKYQEGFSDHLPVLLRIQMENH